VQPKIVFLKSSPAAEPVDLTTTPVRADEPTPAQAESGNYAKRAMPWKGLTIRIENEAGSVRRGTDPGGKAWETHMPHAYGYIVGSMGVDGDPVDVYVGPFAETAESVFVVHQRRVGDWDKYDEDKVFVGFLNEDEVKQAFIQCYDDPRFLGPITAMPVGEFVEKVKTTKENPKMIKSAPRVVMAKSHVEAYTKKDGTFVAAHEDSRKPKQVKSIEHIRQLADQNGGKIYVRWSVHHSHDMKDGAVSRDYANGGVHGGLSAVPITSDMEDHEIAKYAKEYGFLRMKDSKIKPHFYAGEKVGEDSDGYDSIRPTRHIGTGHASFVKELDAGLAEKLRLKRNIEKGEKLLAGDMDVVARKIWEKSVAEDKEKLAGLGGKLMSKSIIFLKAKQKGDDRTPDMFATHVEARTRKDGHVQNYHVANAKPDTVTEPRAELVKEHERLVHVLESPSHADDKAEAKRQKAELEEYKAGGDAGVTVTSRKKVRDPLEGTQTHVTLSNGKTHRLQRLNATESMGLPGWHDVDGGFLGDNEQSAIDELVRRAGSRPAPMIKSIRRMK